LKQLTRDQTTGDFAVELGIMSEEQARRAGLYNRLSSAVGGVLSMSAGLVDLQEGDVLLMCTDGLTKHVSDNEIAGTLKLTATAEETTGLLLKQALDAGASDNVTVIVVRTAEA
jgi:protein phosphatase